MGYPKNGYQALGFIASELREKIESPSKGLEANSTFIVY